MPNAYPWASIPALKKVLSLEFFSVQIQSNQIRFISGIYEEQSPFGSLPPESGEEQYGSYGSYQEDYPRVVKDPETTSDGPG